LRRLSGFRFTLTRLTDTFLRLYVEEEKSRTLSVYLYRE